MPISYVEDITSEFYRLKGYFISNDYVYQVPKKSGKKVRGWKDIDVLAVNDKEVLIIECKGSTGYKNSKKMIGMLLTDFKYAEEIVKNIPLTKGKRIRRILVVDYSVKVIEKILKENGVEVIVLKDLMRDFLKLLAERIKIQHRLGKEEHPITRTLLFLIERGFIKIE